MASLNLPAERHEPSSRDGYRDELNFAEFPLASLSSTLPKGVKTLEFSDQIFDKSRNDHVTRRLTITASDKYGLPTAMDDEVILGLIQLTAQAENVDRKVLFTRYELLKLLNWTDDSRNYSRLKQSLNRWLGVTLYYDHAWWSKEEQSWVSEGFHVLEQVTILDNERRRRRTKEGGQEAGKSFFVWNEVVFNSFRAGYLKQLDFDFYKRLDSAIAKRMYRFLDKRFYRGSRLECDLRTFACEHIGLSKSYHTGELKRVLTPAIAELEEHGFLKRLPPEERFVRKARGEWSAVFVRGSKRAEVAITTDGGLVQELVDRGLNQASAGRLVSGAEPGKVREKIAMFDWLVARRDARVRRNPAGFLYRAISEDFQLPKDYVAAVAPPTRVPPQRVPLQSQTLESHTPEDDAPEVPSDRDAIDRFWGSLPTEEQARIEQELVRSAPHFLRENYVEGKKERGILFKTVRQAIIDTYVRQKLAEAA
ncbi:MAG: replication initiator protein A [Acidobacteria bacterium]|nr:replication initiator protein A [Acidobacteriota bacterium]